MIRYNHFTEWIIKFKTWIRKYSSQNISSFNCILTFWWTYHTIKRSSCIHSKLRSVFKFIHHSLQSMFSMIKIKYSTCSFIGLLIEYNFSIFMHKRICLLTILCHLFKFFNYLSSKFIKFWVHCKYIFRYR